MRMRLALVILSGALLVAGAGVAIVTPLVAVVKAQPQYIGVQPCGELTGTWTMFQYNDKEAINGETWTITDISNDCRFKGSFTTACCRHAITGQIATKGEGGSMTITRTDSAGCTTRLFGQIWQTAGSSFAPWSGIKWRITSSEPGCIPNWHETRWWRRP